MAQTIYGAIVWQEKGNHDNFRFDTAGKNSEVITANDVLSVSSGVLLVNTGTATVVGVAAKTATMTSTNQTINSSTVYPAYIPADDTIFLMGTNADLTGNATDAGTYYGLSGGAASAAGGQKATSGLQLVDVAIGVATGANRIVEIVKVDPQGIGGTGLGSGVRQVLVRFVKTPYTNVQITA